MKQQLQHLCFKKKPKRPCPPAIPRSCQQPDRHQYKKCAMGYRPPNSSLSLRVTRSRLVISCRLKKIFFRGFVVQPEFLSPVFFSQLPRLNPLGQGAVSPRCTRDLKTRRKATKEARGQPCTRSPLNHKRSYPQGYPPLLLASTGRTAAT